VKYQIREKIINNAEQCKITYRNEKTIAQLTIKKNPTELVEILDVHNLTIPQLNPVLENRT
jgi:hypothetical protein